jgi:dihydropyrimidinase
MRTVITNATVVRASGAVDADVVVVDGSIADVIARPPGAVVHDADTVINASGLLLVPGGVDAHVHMQLDVGFTSSSDTFESGSIAAAIGGTTTIVDFSEQRAGGNVLASFEQRLAEAESQCVIDWGLHQVLGGVDAQALIDVRSLIEREGVSSIKLFMAYPGRLYSDDGQLLRALQMCADTGMMAMVHAENGLAIDVLVEQAVAAGNITPDFHSRTRPPELEAEAVHRAAVLSQVAGGAPLYIVHLSSSHALAEVGIARSRGANIFAETCPQYLYLSLEEHLGKGWPEGAGYICSTPLRSRNESHHADLWQGLRNDELAVVSTDHCPFCLREQKLMNGESFQVVPNGIGGVEHRMDLMYQGVVTGELTRERWVEVCATAPARLFGLSRKVDIAPGYDADIVLYDPNATTTISAQSHHMNLDYSAFEGMVIQGGVHTVISRGEVIVKDAKFVGTSGRGKYVRRDIPAVLK